MEVIGDGAKQGAIGLRSRCPLRAQVGVCDGAREPLVPGCQNTPFPHLARAISHGMIDRLAGVEHQVLEVSANAGRDVPEAFTPHAAPGRTQAREVVLRRLDVAGAVAAPIAECARLDDHLIESVVPAKAEEFALPHVLRGDAVIARVELRVAKLEKCHQAAGCDAFRHRVARAGQQLRKIGGQRRGILDRQRNKEKRSCLAKHDPPVRWTPAYAQDIH